MATRADGITHVAVNGGVHYRGGAVYGELPGPVLRGH